MKKKIGFASSGMARVTSDRDTKDALAAAINGELRDRGLSQSAATTVLHMPQSKLSALMNYRLEGFSVQRLCRILNSLGRDVVIQIGVKRTSGQIGKTSVSAA